MYSHEIEQLLKLRNYLLESREYINMVSNSSQISRVRYNPYGDYFEIWTTDNYYFNFKVYHSENKEDNYGKRNL